MKRQTARAINTAKENIFSNPIIVIVFALILIGLLFIYSSTVIHSQNIFGNPHTFFYLHVGWVVIGIIGFAAFYRVDYKFTLNAYKILFNLSVIFLGVLAIASFIPCDSAIIFAKCVNAANRWFYFNPSPLPQIPFLGELSFQPAEFAKLALIIYLAFTLGNMQKNKKSPFVTYLIATGLISGLILLQPNMSTAITVFLIGTIMYFVSGADLKPVLILAPIILLLGLTLMLTSPYRRERVLTYLKHEAVESNLEEGYQIRQVKIALGSGGLMGVGFGQSRQKYRYLPEVASDSIFAILGEEFGFLGTFAISALFLIFVYQGLLVARKAKDLPSRLLAVGITSWIGIQFFIHTLANSGLIPYTGVPIPLISYGGSSMAFSMSGLGILANIHKNS